jgi:2'-5' RNA ligase
MAASLSIDAASPAPILPDVKVPGPHRDRDACGALGEREGSGADTKGSTAGTKGSAAGTNGTGTIAAFRALACTPDHKTALAILPPLELCAAVQLARAVNDPAFPRWPPHINLVYPFVPEEHLGAAATGLAQALVATDAFDVDLPEVGTFPNGNVHLRPGAAATQRLYELRAQLCKVLPVTVVQGQPASHSAHGFSAHLTVGKTEPDKAAGLAGVARAALGGSVTLSFRADTLCLLARSGDADPFHIRHLVTFGGGSASALRVVQDPGPERAPALAAEASSVVVVLPAAAAGRTLGQAAAGAAASRGTGSGSGSAGSASAREGDAKAQAPSVVVVRPHDSGGAAGTAGSDLAWSLRSPPRTQLIASFAPAAPPAPPIKATISYDASRPGHAFLDLAVPLLQLGECGRVVAARMSRRPQHIIVLDRSGSMSAQPDLAVPSAWAMVQQVVRDMQRHQRETPTRGPSGGRGEPSAGAPAAPPALYLAYNDECALVTAEEIARLDADRRTDFVLMLTCLEHHVKRTASAEDVVVTIMTDGCDTVNSPAMVSHAIVNFRREMAKEKRRVQVHAIGFTAAHDLQVLSDLQKAGNTGEEGMFRYAAAPADLDEKFMQLFTYVDGSICLDVTLAIDGATRFVTLAGQVDPSSRVARLSGWVRRPGPREAQPQPAPAFPQTVAASETKRPAERERVDAAGDRLATWDEAGAWVAVGALRQRLCVVPLSPLHAIWVLEALPLDDAKAVLAVQAELSKLKMFGFRMTTAERDELLARRSMLQSRLDAHLRVLAQVAHDGAKGVHATAALKDLRYDAKFVKGRRQRAMDQRAIANRGRLDLLDAQLASLPTLSEGDLAAVRVDDFECFLSCTNVRDVLEGEDRHDVMCMCLCVTRPEHVIDAPEQIGVEAFSPSCATRLNAELAIAHKIRLEGPDAAHGGFDGVGGAAQAFVGAAREPINAVLPLYIFRAHWARVRLLLQPMLGYFFTLDPLGFHPSQYLGLLTVLGHMLHKTPATGGRWSVLLREFRALCKRLLGRARKQYAFAVAKARGPQQAASKPESKAAAPPNPESKATAAPPTAAVPTVAHSAGAATPTAAVQSVAQSASEGSGTAAAAPATCPTTATGLGRHAHSSTAAVPAGTPWSKPAAGADLPARFLAEPAARRKGELGNLMTVVGWHYAAVGDDKPKWQALRLPLIQETVRRAIHFRYSGQPESSTVIHLLRLLYGDAYSQDAAPEPAEVRAAPEPADAKAAPAARGGAASTGRAAAAAAERRKALDAGWGAWARYHCRQDAKFRAEPADDPDEPLSLANRRLSAAGDCRATLEALEPAAKSGLDVLDRVFARVGLTIEVDLAVRRAMYVQALHLLGGDDFSRACDRGECWDAATDADKILALAHAAMERQSAQQQKRVHDEGLAQRRARAIAQTKDLDAFIGRLLHHCPSRGGMIWDRLVPLLQDPANPYLPLRADKVQILFTGKAKYGDKWYPVLAEGTIWVPPSVTVDRFRGAIGQNALIAIENLMRGSSTHWVYRASDKRNRHGHSNSHPNHALSCRFSGFGAKP